MTVSAAYVLHIALGALRKGVLWHRIGERRTGCRARVSSMINPDPEMARNPKARRKCQGIETRLSS